MKIFDENNNELDPTTLDYEIGYLTKKADQQFVYHLFTQKQLIDGQLFELNQELEETKEQAIKFADGELTEQEFAPIRTRRAELKAEIERLSNAEV